jgi:tRNA(fMet)-specific endonuclease VapC
VIHVDTSFLIDLMREQARQKPGPAVRFLEEHAGDAIGASVFVVCELEAGAARAARPDSERAKLRTIVQALSVAYPDERFAPVYGDLLGRVLAAGRSVSAMDLLIATAAVVEGASLVTGNRKHFDVIPDLRVLTYRSQSG